MSSRIEYLDVAKFIGLILVCFCHIPLPEGNFHIWVYSFHMPLFFLLSGVFFSPEKFTIGRSAMQLLLPFIVFNLLVLFFSLIIGSVTSGELKLPSISWSAVIHSYYPIGPSWFLLALCVIRVYTGVILKYLNNLWLVIISIFIVIALALTSNEEIWSLFSIGSSVMGLPFYLIGYYLKDLVTDIRHFNKWYMSITALVISILAVFNGQVGIHVTDFGNNFFLFILFGVVGTFTVVSLSTWIKIPQRILSVFMDGALFFICMHTLIFEYMILGWNKLTGDFTGNTLTEKIIFTILTFAVSYPIILILLKDVPILLGKSGKVNK